MKLHDGVSVYVEGGGTASGVKNLIHSRSDICAASRPLRPQEVRQLAKRYNTVGLTFTVAKEALSVYVHPQNPVDDLTLEQLKAIFTGEIRNWRSLGGTDAPISVLTRSPNSGTYLYFQEHVLTEEPYLSSARVMPTTQSVVNGVLENPHAIGYGGVAYGTTLHSNINGIAPSRENVISGDYPITRYLYLVTAGSPRGETKEFIDWILSPGGQSLVDQAGYVPLWPPTPVRNGGSPVKFPN
jgi:phosphate transport system substrate-binding protein